MASNSPGFNATMDSSDMSKAPRIVFLLLFMVSSFVGSLFILIVLAHNTKLRKVQNLLTANLCVVCIIDCIFNMTLVLGSLIVDEWVYGSFMCKVNNFCMNLVAIQTVLMLTALSIDRYFSLRYSYKYEAWFSSYRIWLVTAYFWLHSLIFSIPFLTDAVASSFRPQLHLCTFTGETSLAFLYTTLLVSFLGPLIIIIVFHIISFRLSCQLRDSRRADNAQKTYTQMLNEKPEETQHFYTSCSFTATLVVLWIILEIPFIITSYIKQYEYSQQFEQGTLIDYPWEVDATFIWMRFFYTALFPLITFAFKKDIWQSTKECLLCRRHNSVVDMEIQGMASVDTSRKENSQQKCEKEWSPKLKDQEKDKENVDTPYPPAFSVPVLFATSTGICIEDSSSGNSREKTMQALSTIDILQRKGKALDITYPEYDYANELMGDTSDYDSSCEIDQYSSSQPVSTRNVQGTLHRTRSMSDPEINLHAVQEKSKNKDFGGTFGADSGLDLSATAGSSIGSRARSKSRTTQVHGHFDDVNVISSSRRIPPKSNTDHSYSITPKADLRPGVDSRCPEGRTSSDAVDVSTRPLPPRLKPLDNKETVRSPVKTKRKRHKSKKNEHKTDMDPMPDKDSNTEDGQNVRRVSGTVQKTARESPRKRNIEMEEAPANDTGKHHDGR